jgi:hypothetical protein
MMLTQEEAMEKWCPFVRLVLTNNDIMRPGTPTYNRTGEAEGPGFKLPKGAACIGSTCMAWRGYDFHKEFGGTTQKGYCGLAGRPER